MFSSPQSRFFRVLPFFPPIFRPKLPARMSMFLFPGQIAEKKSPKEVDPSSRYTGGVSLFPPSPPPLLDEGLPFSRCESRRGAGTGGKAAAGLLSPSCSRRLHRRLTFPPSSRKTEGIPFTFGAGFFPPLLSTGKKHSTIFFETFCQDADEADEGPRPPPRILGPR